MEQLKEAARPAVGIRNLINETKKAKLSPEDRTSINVAGLITPFMMINEPRHEENRLFAYAKTKTHISFAVTAKLISAFVYATRIGQSLYFIYTKLQASTHLVCLYSLVCV